MLCKPESRAPLLLLLYLAPWRRFSCASVVVNHQCFLFFIGEKTNKIGKPANGIHSTISHAHRNSTWGPNGV